VKLFDLLLQYFPLIEGNANARLCWMFHLRLQRIEKSSNVHVIIFTIDADIDGSTNVMVEDDVLAFFVLSDAFVNVWYDFVEHNPSP